MKLTFTFLLTVLSFSLVFAQKSIPGTLSYNGANYPADQIEYNLPPAEAEKIIRDRMKSMGFTPERGKGYIVYRNVTMRDLSFGEPKDIIFKVDRKSKRESGASVISLITAKPGEIPTGKVKGAGKALSNITTASSAGSFLESFQDQMSNQAHNLSVLSKSDEIKKAEKRLENLQKDQSKIEKKIKDLESDLQSNLKNQEKQSAEIEALKKQLDVLKESGQ